MVEENDVDGDGSDGLPDLGQKLGVQELESMMNDIGPAHQVLAKVCS
jgi:hypothetical protein